MLVAGSKSNNLEMFRHFFQKANSVRSDTNVSYYFVSTLELNRQGDIIRFAVIFLRM